MTDEDVAEQLCLFGAGKGKLSKFGDDMNERTTATESLVKRQHTSTFLCAQLLDLGRVFDLKGGRLPISMVEETAYELRRYRESNHPVDIYTTTPVIDNMWLVLSALVERKYGIQPNQFRPTRPSPIGLFLEFSFPAVRIAVFEIGHTDPPRLWMLDWSDITEDFAILTPERHAIITNFTAVVDYACGHKNLEVEKM